MKLESANHKHGYYQFDSWGEFLDFAKANTGKNHASSAKVGTAKFTGTNSFDECLELARNGWIDGEERVAAMSARILAKVTGLIEREHVVYDIEGIGIDVATFLDGEPECWQRFDTEITEGQGTKHVRIVYNASVSGGIGKEIIEARGAAVSALIQALEFAGTRVELWVAAIACSDTYSAKTAEFEARVLVKSADQDLDMSRVAFALAHPSTLRRLGFACLEADDAASTAIGCGYGMPSPVYDKGDLYIDSGMMGEALWGKPESAIAWVLGKLIAQGVNLAKDGV